ncbi:hypothetical protein [Serratia sp. CY81593]|uniref:hypothetical protein n=1 Tax=Serratia sp. CY81593 TaxID=3383685 RepID=UPI001EEDAC65|nr:hypothetical protein LBP97_01880 [Serratia marcescens]
MLGESGFAHGDLLRGHNQYVGRSLKVNGSDYRDTYNKRWREQIRHEQEQRALAYFSLDAGQEADNHRPSTTSIGINTIKRPLSKLERQIGSFAESIGFSLDACILKSLTRGASVVIGGQRYRARTDGCLYQQSTPAATTALTRLTALWHQQVPEQSRLIGNHLRREAKKQESEE